MDDTSDGDVGGVRGAGLVADGGGAVRRGFGVVGGVEFLGFARDFNRRVADGGTEEDRNGVGDGLGVGVHLEGEAAAENDAGELQAGTEGDLGYEAGALGDNQALGAGLEDLGAAGGEVDVTVGKDFQRAGGDLHGEGAADGELLGAGDGELGVGVAGEQHGLGLDEEVLGSAANDEDHPGGSGGVGDVTGVGILDEILFIHVFASDGDFAIDAPEGILNQSGDGVAVVELVWAVIGQEEDGGDDGRGGAGVQGGQIGSGGGEFAADFVAELGSVNRAGVDEVGAAVGGIDHAPRGIGLDGGYGGGAQSEVADEGCSEDTDVAAIEGGGGGSAGAGVVVPSAVDAIAGDAREGHNLHLVGLGGVDMDNTGGL